MNGRVSGANLRSGPLPALTVACWLALGAGCGTDTTLLTDRSDDVSSEVDPARARPPAAGAREPDTLPAPSEEAAPWESAPMPGATPGPGSSGEDAPGAGSRTKEEPEARDTPIEGVFGNWCARMGVEVDDATDACIDAAIAYFDALTDDCTVSGLVSGWSRDQTIDWGNYVIEYMYLFTGCPFEGEPEQGGLSVFGPAHLEPAGLPSPALGLDDALSLSEHFTTALVTMLALTESDRVAVQRTLAASAAQQIDANLSGVLSQCAGNDPNSADAGAADAGR